MFFFFFFFLLLLLLFLTSNKPDRHDGRVPSQQGASTTCNLTYWEISHQTYLQTLLASLVVAKGHNSDLLSGRGGGLGKIGVAKRATFSPSVKRGGASDKNPCHLFQTSIALRHQQLSSSRQNSRSRNIFFPSKSSSQQKLA